MDLLKEKLRLLESLTDIEIAYRLIRAGGALSANYAKLRTRLVPLDSNTLEYSRIEDYLRNSHAKEHGYFSLSVENVFTVERQGEREKFAPFKQLHNHKLLVCWLLLAGLTGVLCAVAWQSLAELHWYSVARPENCAA